ncbi:MAG: hypothetical protein LE169_02905 [Endomicrobium sp.]|nr:hypothetical protein [Endomicrobium sp.]
MKKIICVCLCICLISGCDKSFNRGSPVNAVAEDKAPHSLTSDTPNASAPEPSNTPAPTPEPSKSVPPASDTADTGSSVGKIGAVILSVIVVCYVGYKLLYRFASIKPISVDDLKIFNSVLGNYSLCYFKDNYFFDMDSDEYIDEIPVKVCTNEGMVSSYHYIPNLSKLKLLKTWLRKIFRIEIPVPKK